MTSDIVVYGFVRGLCGVGGDGVGTPYLILKEHWGLLDTSLYAAQIRQGEAVMYLFLAAALGLAALFLFAVIDFLWALITAAEKSCRNFVLSPLLT